MTFGSRPSNGPYEEYPLWDVLRRTAGRLPNKTAVIDGQRTFTFAQLDNQSTRFAVALINLGIGIGDRVGLFSPNCAEFVISYYGILKAGATVVPVNAAYRELELAHQLDNADVSLLITHEVLRDVAQATKNRVTSLNTLVVIGQASDGEIGFHDLVKTSGLALPDISINPREHLAALPSSSGTTGLPKGVMLSHFNLTVNMEQTVNRPGEKSAITEDDVLIVHLPLFHSYGMTVLMNAAIGAGATQVHMGRFNMDEFLMLMETNKITMLFTVPPVVLGVTQVPEIKTRDFSSLRLCLSGAAPLSKGLQDKFEDLTGVPTAQGYGLTETSPVTNLDFGDASRRRSGSIGPPVADTEEKIVAADNGIDELPVRRSGELIIKGPQVMNGYWRNPEATAETVKEGWLYTGDLAWMDEDGYVYIVDRKKELIKYKGFQVPPAEMEALLLGHPEIVDVAVVGKPDVEAGELPKAYVVAKNKEVRADEIMAYVAERVAGFKKIREVEFTDEIPKSPSGKILRRVLVDMEREKARG